MKRKEPGTLLNIINFGIRSLPVILIVFVILNHIIEFPDLLQSVLGVTYILYVPYTIGHLVLAIAKMSISSLARYVDRLQYSLLIIKWFIGVFVVFVTSLVVVYMNLTELANVGVSFLVIGSLHQLFKPQRVLVMHINILKVVVFPSLILAFSYGLYIRSFSPFPLTPGMDLFTHLFSIKSFIAGNLEAIPLVYLPTFDSIIALASETFSLDPLNLFWTGSIFVFGIFGLAIYALTFWLTRNSFIAFVGCIIALSITEQGKASNLQFFYPSSILMAIFPIIFIVLEELWLGKPTRSFLSYGFIFSIVALGGFLMLHLQLGQVVVFISIVYVLLRFAVEKTEFAKFSLRTITIMFTVIVLLLYVGISTLQIEYFPLVSNTFELAHQDTPALKIKDLGEWYTVPIIVSSIFGLILCSFIKSNRLLVIAFIGAMLLWVYFQQFGNIQRIMPLERSILSISCSLILFSPLFVFELFLSRKRREKTQTKSISEIQKMRLLPMLDYFKFLNFPKKIILYTFVLFLLLFPLLLAPYAIYTQVYFEKDYDFVNLTEDEYQIGQWIQRNTPPNSVIYSDPATVLIMRGLGFREQLPGIGWNTTLANEVKHSMLFANASEAQTTISSTAGKNALIVISPRTSEWIRDPTFFKEDSDPGNYFIQWPVGKFSHFGGLEKFFDERFFTVVYNQSDFYIFTVNDSSRL